MEKIFKEDYEALKECASHTRAELKVFKEQGDYEITDKEEKRLIELEYIDWKDKSKRLSHKDFILTKQGEEAYRQLRDNWRKDLSLMISILALAISIIAFFLGLKRV